ncbi:hypothetical protein OV079_07985 [Nannocystis pusilla]|uniref:Uncharacterized protein n=1 Tax=Nannocystis pusilla TaxID=889268 RepID=A0A9X3EK21_9BACT|nr:hypothetical protein [Nannocystis pusilla]MCY1005513.1 hypothetical protein [Nannocystis pusilla]
MRELGGGGDGGLAAAMREQPLDRLGQDVLGLAGDEKVGEGQQTAGVGEGEGTADDEDRIVLAALGGQHRNT